MKTVEMFMREQKLFTLWFAGLLIILIACSGSKPNPVSGKDVTNISKDDTLWRAPDSLPPLPALTLYPSTLRTIHSININSLESGKSKLIDSINKFSYVIDTVAHSADGFLCRSHFNKLENLNGISKNIWVYASLKAEINSSESGYVLEIRLYNIWAAPKVHEEWQAKNPPELHNALIEHLDKFKASFFE